MGWGQRETWVLEEKNASLVKKANSRIWSKPGQSKPNLFVPSKIIINHIEAL